MTHKKSGLSKRRFPAQKGGTIFGFGTKEFSIWKLRRSLQSDMMLLSIERNKSFDIMSLSIERKRG